MDGATFMGNAGIPCVPRPIPRHSVVTGITDRAYLPAYEKLCRPLPALLLTLALMCENVNSAPITVPCGEWNSGAEMATTSSCAGVPSVPPFKLSHPLCQTGFTIAMRYDERNAAGTIIKSVWVRKCTKGKVIYGGKV